MDKDPIFWTYLNQTKHVQMIDIVMKSQCNMCMSFMLRLFMLYRGIKLTHYANTENQETTKTTTYGFQTSIQTG